MDAKTVRREADLLMPMGGLASMFEERDQRIDLCTLVLVALSVFLTLSLISYSPSDAVGDSDSLLHKVYQPDVLVYPPNEKAANYCGPIGAIAATRLSTAAVRFE